MKLYSIEYTTSILYRRTCCSQKRRFMLFPGSWLMVLPSFDIIVTKSLVRCSAGTDDSSFKRASLLSVLVFCTNRALLRLL